jgi:MFS family permease
VRAAVHGGFLVEHLLWWWTFWVEIPIGIATPVITDRCGLCHLRAGGSHRPAGSLLYRCRDRRPAAHALARKEFAWNSAWTFGLTAAALVVLAARVCQEGGTAEPIMPRGCSQTAPSSSPSRADSVVGVAMFGAVIFLPST